jgi:hypothetical protein
MAKETMIQKKKEIKEFDRLSKLTNELKSPLKKTIRNEIEPAIKHQIQQEVSNVMMKKGIEVRNESNMNYIIFSMFLAALIAFYCTY